MSNRAWVTLATNDSYGLGALVLAHSLRRAGSTYPAVVLITPSVTEAMRERLNAVFAELINVDVLDSRDATHLALLQRPELGITFTKIHCWSLTQFEKCVFLDADTLIVQNCDELFEREELSAAPDVGWPDCFNSGVFVFTPSADTYSRLISFAQERGSFDGGDQGLLNAFFSDWARGDINKHLPFLYNVTSAAFYSYLPALKHYGQNLKIIHFIGSAKPWLQQFNWQSQSVDAPEHLREFLQLWWDLFVSQVHPQLDTAMSGVAGNLARVVPGDVGYQREAIDELSRRQGWEAGNIDYMGADSFDNIWAKISQTLNQTRTSPPKQPSPPRKEPSPPKAPEAQPPTAAEPAVAVTAPVATETPEPAVAETPVPAAVETTALAATESSVPAVEETPVLAAAETSAPITAETSASVATKTSVPAAAETPVPAAADTPAPVAVESPATTEAPVPAEIAPVQTETPAPVQEETLAPEQAALQQEVPVPPAEPSLLVEPAAPEAVPSKEAGVAAVLVEPLKLEPEAKPAQSEIPKTTEQVIAIEKTEPVVPPTPPATPKSTPEASPPVLETPLKIEATSVVRSAPAAVESPKAAESAQAVAASPAPAAETPVIPVPPASAPLVATPEKPSETSVASTDSPPLANTPSKEEAPAAPAAKSEERRKPAGKLQLSPPAAADPLPTPDSEVEDAAALAHAIIASELSATVTAPSPSVDPASPLPSKEEKKLSVEDPQVPTPPVSLEQIGVKPKGKTTTASQIESSIAEKAEPATPTTPTPPTTPTTPSTPSTPSTPTAEAPKKKTVKKIVKKEAGPSGDVPTPVPPPRKKEKKPKEK
ncbi:proteoglycan 4-like isoform X4 [Hyposmocoma kahamanoa]|uniref:proteoglycan 4-like isoform X4 n=1 Tax=Hyposmocoma kahamanoa TaxID=1477025 RepID=UPI000E6D629F|nr:proteoglycan 4-like isoform X4 [Hyposmocoma kahamanoa]